MVEIKLVEQEDHHGCSAACFAMVLGKTYKEIVADFQNDFEEQGLKFDQSLSYLGDKGFSIVHKRITCYLEKDFARKEMLKPFAPVHIVRTVDKFDSKNGHLVVMTDKGKILCPSGVSDKEIRKSYLITDVAGLYKENA